LGLLGRLFWCEAFFFLRKGYNLAYLHKLVQPPSGVALDVLFSGLAFVI